MQSCYILAAGGAPIVGDAASFCVQQRWQVVAFPILQQNQIKGVSQYLDLSAFSNHQEQDNSVHFKCAQEQVVLDSTTMYRQCGYLWIFIGDH